MKDEDRVRVKYSLHLQHRLGVRKIDKKLPEKVFLEAEERYKHSEMCIFKLQPML